MWHKKFLVSVFTAVTTPNELQAKNEKSNSSKWIETHSTAKYSHMVIWMANKKLNYIKKAVAKTTNHVKKFDHACIKQADCI